MESVSIPAKALERLRRIAEKEGSSLEALLVEISTQDLDPEEKWRDYLEAAVELLEQARKELESGDLRQASEKIWGAAALAVKAHALAKRGKRLSSHGELWEYKEVLVSELGEWVREAWAYAVEMHVNFYEGWGTGEDVKRSLEAVEKLAKSVSKVLGEKP